MLRSPVALRQALVGSRSRIPRRTSPKTLWNAEPEFLPPRTSARHSLNTLLQNDTLLVTRQIELLNVLAGYEQANRYALNNIHGEPLGYLVEEPRGFLATIGRQIFRTHRPFRALVMDLHGSPILWIRRPFAWISSCLYAQHQNLNTDVRELEANNEPILETFGEVQQRWHLWRRRYELFIREHAVEEPGDQIFEQFAKIDAGFLAWHFVIQDSRGDEIASISRGFRGFGRELFTDTGQYMVRFTPDLETPATRPSIIAPLSLDERALILALSVSIDFDYFSRHSGHGAFGFPFVLGGWSSDE